MSYNYTGKDFILPIFGVMLVIGSILYGFSSNSSLNKDVVKQSTQPQVVLDSVSVNCMHCGWNNVIYFHRY